MTRGGRRCPGRLLSRVLVSVGEGYVFILSVLFLPLGLHFLGPVGNSGSGWFRRHISCKPLRYVT
jgi:hypothetical protein